MRDIQDPSRALDLIWGVLVLEKMQLILDGCEEAGVVGSCRAKFLSE